MKSINIVLVEPSHPGNIGAAARAMKNMALSRLTLVNPEAFPHEYATARAAGAEDILQNAKVVTQLDEAIADADIVYGTSARTRTLEWPLCTPRECATQIMTQSADSIAILFGREKSGLTNDELSRCHFHISIPTNKAFSSLNLGAAVQIIAYELFIAQQPVGMESPAVERQDLASVGEVQGFYEHLEQTLTQIEFLDPNQPKMLMKRLKRLYNRAQLDHTELNILRGILSAINRNMSKI